jgi:hypothetical protein
MGKVGATGEGIGQRLKRPSLFRYKQKISASHPMKARRTEQGRGMDIKVMGAEQFYDAKHSVST